jgi:hypothetical protein
MIHTFLELFRSDIFLTVIDYIVFFAWLWIPILLGTLFFQTWIRYIRTKYIHKQEGILLELKLPKEITKSPAAMEVVIQAMAQPSVGNYIDVYLGGKVRSWFSLEICSLGGQVKFFIWTHKKFKSVLESQIYSQFPNVEVTEVPDYAMQTEYYPSEVTLWGTQLALTKPDPYPIKTYIDYGLDKNPDEEFKIDPITPLIEFLGSIKPGEQIWIQILIQAHKKENLKDLRVKEKPDWKKDITKEIKKIIEEQGIIKPEDGKQASMGGLTDSQRDVIKAMERNAAKIAFETMIRAIYIAPKDVFNGNNAGGVAGLFKQFGSMNLNGFKPNFSNGADYPWEDFKGLQAAKRKRKLFDAYRRRSIFNIPFKNFEGAKPFILTTEELATLFHFPGGVASTPTLTRTPSRKAEPPSNLPI